VTFTDTMGDTYNTPLMNGVAVLILQPASGTYTFTAAYSGDSTYAPSTSAPKEFTVAPPSSTTLGVTPNPGPFGQMITLTGTILPTSVTGTVTFYDHSTTVLAVVPICSTSTPTACAPGQQLGTASYTTSTLQSGLRSITAFYSGDSVDLPSTSAAITEGILSQVGLGFAPPALNSTGSGSLPEVLAIADINGDGIADIVVGNYGAQSIMVFFGRGNGTFETPLSYPTGARPLGIAVGDFNGDGNPDVAVAGSDGIDVFYGAGSGLLNPFVNVSAVPASGLAIADFNQDGYPDIVASVTGGTSVNVLISSGPANIGTGFPSAPISCATSTGSSTGTNPLGVAVGDLTGSGVADIVVANDSGVTVLLGNFNAATSAYSCQAGVNYPVGNNPRIVLVKDVNGDSIQDIAVTNFADGTVSILLGQGSGVFGAPKPFPTGPQPAGLAFGDVNGDGRPDLIVADAVPTNGSYLFTLLGEGNGSFEAPAGFLTDPGLAAVGSASFNGAGTADIAVVSQSNNNLDILLNGYPTLQVTGGNTQSTPIYTTFPTALTVNAAGFGVPAAHASVTFTAGTGFFAGYGSTATVLTDLSGNASAPPYTAGTTPGPDTVTATAGGNTVSFSLVDVVQPCTFTVSPTSLLFDANGGGQTFTVTPSSSTCQWTAASSYSNVLLSGTSGVGNGIVNVLIPQNTTGALQSENLFIAGQLIPVQIDATAQIFQDVTPNDYFFDYANEMYMKGITEGCSQTPLLYCPTETVTRAQMAVFLVTSIYGSSTFPYNPTPYFTDVPVGSFGFPWIQAMYELGLTSGCGTNLFCPNNPVTRAEMAVFVIDMRYGATAQFDYPATAFFTDVPVGAFAFPWIQRMREDLITVGCTTTTYCPNNNVLRQDMAVFILRGGFNFELGFTAPVITSINPSSIPVGQATTVTVNGANTSFVQNVTVVNPIPGVTIGAVNVISPTLLQVTLTPTAVPLSPESVWVSTGLDINGGTEAVLPNSLTITPGADKARLR
jgi:hypothetical protein